MLRLTLLYNVYVERLERRFAKGSMEEKILLLSEKLITNIFFDFTAFSSIDENERPALQAKMALILLSS